MPTKNLISTKLESILLISAKITLKITRAAKTNPNKKSIIFFTPFQAI